MSQQVTLEDGSIHAFPDDATQDEMTSALSSIGTPNNQPQSQSPMGEQFARQLGLTGRYLEGAFPKTFTGAADLINAPINAISGTINKYAGTNIPALHTDLSDLVNKKLTDIGFPQPQGAMEEGIAIPSQILTGLMTGGSEGLNTLKQMGSNAIDMVTPAAKVGPTTAAQAKKIASEFYQQATDNGGILKPQFTNNFIDKVSSIAPQTDAGKIFAGETPVTKLVERLQGLKDKSLTLPAIQEIDEHLGNMIDAEHGITGLSKEGKNLLEIQSSLRNMIKDASSEDVVGGSTEGFDALNSGRKAYSQAMKMGDLERIQTRASLSDNPATAIKSGVRTLLSNPSRVRGYSLDEINALQKAADRGVLGGTLHVFGSRLIPLGTGLLGESLGGPFGAAVGMGAGHAGSTMMRNAATSLQTNRLNNAIELLGSKVPK